MAKEHEEREERTEHHEGGKGGKKKLHLHAITTRKLKDGTYVHEHHYKDHPDAEYTHPPRMMGTSQDLNDVHQHIEDNWGGEEGGPPEEGGQEQGGAPGEEPGEERE